MSDNLGDDDIERFLGLPMSSELDYGNLSDGFLGGSAKDSDESDGDDEMDIDPDFQPTLLSTSESEHSNNEGDVNEYNMNLYSATNETDTQTESVNDQNDRESMNEDLDEGAGGDYLNGDVYVTLGERYKKLKKKEDKLKMKKEEEDKWKLPEGRQKNIVFGGNSEYKFNLPRTAQPIDFFSSYLNDEILAVMVDETNRNAAQVLQKIRLNGSSRLRTWRDTNVEEMKKFLGLLLYMGLVPMPRITDYWSRRLLYRNLVANRVMSRNRFQLLLRFWHFNNNDNLDQEGRLAKILPLVSHLNQCFKRNKNPGEDLVIDESMIPFRGRLIFRQYLPQKAHKYGIKVFKVCDTTGYTLKTKVYMGKGTGIDEGSSLAMSVVMDLINDYLDKGHTLYIDNFYTSLDLANVLLTRQTHLVGTVIANRAWFPHKKTIPPNLTLGTGEMSCLEYPNGTTYTRWVDKREVRIMSTKHTNVYEDTGKRSRNGTPILKPQVVVHYHKAKMGIDLSDQMSSYSSAVRKSMRWYHKIAEEMLLGTAVVNAWLGYKEAVGATGQAAKRHVYSITTFREKVAYALLGLRDEEIDPVRVTGHHHLTETAQFEGEGRNKRRVRRHCKICYQQAQNAGGRETARKSKKVNTFCETCPQKPFLCKDCFRNTHK
ncbi:piggyBac transposable element-derived protein 4-like [Macrosteles quadrilineatus]|uniref:piggyBac transposable element-derived protein 4-like n=1 Tax=Macrosteles quadrilineatus TaxID=74068 RepID=UPI0023E0F09E|nr:piggyBac transposable element-derived protein 4-like [Macrosteles quadrilineatus]